MSQTRSLVQPINQLYRFMNEATPMRIWLRDDSSMFIDGRIIGFDEYMNCTLDDAYEVDAKTGDKKSIKRILLKGDCIAMMALAPTMSV